MICPKCNNEIPDAAKFCSFCGAPVETTVEENIQTPAMENAVEENIQNSFENQQQFQQGNPEILQNSFVNQPVTPIPPQKKKVPAIVFVLIPLIFIGGIVFVISTILGFVGKANLHNQLQRDWSRTEHSDSSYYTLVLDFDEDTIEYNFDSTYDWIDTTIATYKYKVISSNKIEITRDSGITSVIEIEFNDDKDMLTMTPALTSVDSSENWFNFK